MDLNLHNVNAKLELLARQLGYFYEDNMLGKEIIIHKREKPKQCSFCGKSVNEVDKLISGRNVTICNECVDLCNEIINEEKEDKTNHSGEDSNEKTK